VVHHCTLGVSEAQQSARDSLSCTISNAKQSWGAPADIFACKALPLGFRHIDVAAGNGKCLQRNVLDTLLRGNRALWGACQDLSMRKGGCAQFHTCHVASVQQLQLEHGPYSSTVIAAGAAAGVLPEIGVALCLPLSHNSASIDHLA